MFCVPVTAGRYRRTVCEKDAVAEQAEESQQFIDWHRECAPPPIRH